LSSRIATLFVRTPGGLSAHMSSLSLFNNVVKGPGRVLSEQSRNVLFFGKVEMSYFDGAPASTRPAIPSSEELFPHRGLAPSRPPAFAPKGSLDGWPRCKTIELEGMAGLCADDYPAVKLAKNRTFLLCRDRGREGFCQSKVEMSCSPAKQKCPVLRACCQCESCHSLLSGILVASRPGAVKAACLRAEGKP
jgi:hypothetical protein